MRSLMLVAAMLISFGVQAQSDPLIGTWKQNLAKSKYDPAYLAPKEGRTTKIDAVPGGIKLVTDGVDVQGQVGHVEYTVKFDGKDYPYHATIQGRINPNQDVISWRKIGDYTYELTAKVKGRVLTTTHMVISSDGKTRTTTITGTNAQGTKVNDTLVYEKQ